MPAAAQGLPTAEQLADDQGVTLALHQCAGCATVQLANPPVPYWREVIRAAGLSAEMRAFRREQFGRWIAEHDLTGRKVLEVGCGRGEYLALLAEAGADAHGLEYAPAAVAACHAAGLHAHRGFLEDPSIRLASGPFDGFAILNFLEHIPAAPLTLQAIAEYPLITYHEGFTGRARIDQAFAAASLDPDIVMSALDADVIKAYVELGLGVGIVASMAYDPNRDQGLRMLASSHLFEENVTRIAIRKGHFLRGFAYRFIELCSADLSENVVRAALRPDADGDPSY